jgi:hypothetical protein
VTSPFIVIAIRFSFDSRPVAFAQPRLAQSNPILLNRQGRLAHCARDAGTLSRGAADAANWHQTCSQDDSIRRMNEAAITTGEGRAWTTSCNK